MGTSMAVFLDNEAKPRMDPLMLEFDGSEVSGRLGTGGGGGGGADEFNDKLTMFGIFPVIGFEDCGLDGITGGGLVNLVVLAFEPYFGIAGGDVGGLLARFGGGKAR